MFKSKALRVSFCGLVCLGILIGMLLRHAWPVWFGKIIYLKVQPVDPRDIFRGEYVVLSYDIDRLALLDLPAPENRPRSNLEPRNGTVVYVQLKPVPSRVPGVPMQYKPVSISKTLQPDVINLEGRVGNGRTPSGLDFGINALFLQENKGRQIEDCIRAGKDVFAEIAVSSAGRARVKNLVINGKKVLPEQ
jgi:uncharacterized membrane-anchored protein